MFSSSGMNQDNDGYVQHFTFIMITIHLHLSVAMVTNSIAVAP